VIQELPREAWSSPSGVTDLALRFPLWHPAVATVIVSISSLAHADEALDAVSGARPDIERFVNLAAALKRGAGASA
jgi:aryl-alcohol dehydrogenase-like predicted oxidoreductase